MAQKAIRVSALTHSPAKHHRSSARGGLLQSPRYPKILMTQVQPAAPAQKTAEAHRPSCKRTAFSIAIHILSTIANTLNLMQSAICAIFSETQPQKRAQLRRIFSVAQLSRSAYSRERCRGIDNSAFAFLTDNLSKSRARFRRVRNPLLLDI